MFKCASCGRTTKAGDLAHRVVIDRRDKEYPPSDDQRQENPTQGWEIVKEILVCGECAAPHKGGV